MAWLQKEVNSRFRHILGPLVAICLVAYFIYHIIQGERGVLSWIRLEQKLKDAQQDLSHLQAEKKVLENRVSLLRPKSLDHDMLDEQARKMLNLAQPDEVVIVTPETANSQKS